MKPILFFAALLCATLTSNRLAAQNLNAEMTALANAWKATFERGDATAVAALYAEKVVFVNSKDGSEETATRADVEADMKKTLEAYTGTFVLAPGSTATLLPDGKVSIKGEFTQTMTDKKRVKNKYSTAFSTSRWLKKTVSGNFV
jgi:hypothetical protein